MLEKEERGRERMREGRERERESEGGREGGRNGGYEGRKKEWIRREEAREYIIFCTCTFVQIYYRYIIK